MFLFFFFKQKTAYEIYQCDWSSDVCSSDLKGGKVTGWRFTRAVIRVAANIPYEAAQAAIDGQADHPLTETALKPLWACWRLLAKARDARAPLDLDLPDRPEVIYRKGGIGTVA